MHGMIQPANDAVAIEPAAALLLRAAARDAAAFGQLARQVARPSLALAIRVVGDHQLAEDVVQEALSKLWREAGRFDPSRGSFAGWWRRILMNSALDSRRKLRVVTPLDEAGEVADPGPSPQRLAEQADLAARVEQAAAPLPARQRAAISLFYGEGLSMQEIADALETSEKAVEGLLLRARTSLKELLKDLKDEKS